MNKEKIVQAALELACEKGIGRISMSQIAEKVGIKKSTLYSHYPSKDAIITEMYSYLRNQANNGSDGKDADYGKLIEGRSLREILLYVVNSYKKLNSDPKMELFYKAIYSERATNPVSAEIMVTETKRMILATKQLFYAIQAKRIAEFGNPDAAALSFAMGVHALLEYEFDTSVAGTNDADGLMEMFVEEFGRIYEKKGEDQ